MTPELYHILLKNVILFSRPIEEHIYHFLTGLPFSFFLPIPLLLSPGYIGTLPLPEKKRI